MAKASRATREHYEGLLRECEGRWRQELAKRSRGESGCQCAMHAWLSRWLLHSLPSLSLPFPSESHKAVCDFGCQTQLAAGDSLQRKIQEQIEATRQALKRDVAQLVGVVCCRGMPCIVCSDVYRVVTFCLSCTMMAYVCGGCGLLWHCANVSTV